MSLSASFAELLDRQQGASCPTARPGTSGPAFAEKYRDQNSSGPGD
jgi:hypothetical protein